MILNLMRCHNTIMSSVTPGCPQGHIRLWTGHFRLHVRPTIKRRVHWGHRSTTQCCCHVISYTPYAARLNSLAHLPRRDGFGLAAFAMASRRCRAVLLSIWGYVLTDQDERRDVAAISHVHHTVQRMSTRFASRATAPAFRWVEGSCLIAYLAILTLSIQADDRGPFTAGYRHC
jgi:hypothetical protein